MKEDPDLLHMDRTEFHLNRIMKRQGAKPPWIELQNGQLRRPPEGTFCRMSMIISAYILLEFTVELDAAHASFRSTLLESYSRAVVRSLVTSPYHDNASLSALTVEDISKLRDSRWQAREQAYHAEHIKSLNNIVRRMNAQAPQVARRGLVVLQNELDLLYQDAAPIIHAELVKRRNADWDKKKAGGDFRYGSEDNSGNGNGAFSGAWQLTTGKVGLVIVAMGGLTYIVQQTVSTNGKGSNSSQGSRGDQYGNRGNHGGSSVVASSPAEEEVGFSSIRIIKVYILEPISTFFRFLRLAMLFGPVILTAPMLLVGTPAASKRRRAGVVVDEGERWGAVWWFGFLVRQMEKAGPTFIKLGQWAASRADLFPASLCELMGKLHSNGHPHALSYTKQVLEEAFQESFDDIFDEFEEEPIGCGAIAQVYRAKLNSKLLPESFMAKRTKQSTKDGVPIEEVVNTSVAVKVVHPRVEQNIRRDLAIMSLFANVLNLFPGMEWLSLPEEVDVFGDMMNMQLDLRVEANNLERFINNFEHRGPGISFPRPIRTKGEHTGDAARKVLVEEYEDALPLKYFLVNGGGQYDAAIANSGLDAFLVSRETKSNPMTQRG
jgi:aarF domain-containing kinase